MMNKSKLDELKQHYIWAVLTTTDLVFKLLEDEHYAAAKCLVPSVKESLLSCLNKFDEALLETEKDPLVEADQPQP
jgi:hypothetical protein